MSTIERKANLFPQWFLHKKAAMVRERGVNLLDNSVGVFTSQSEYIGVAITDIVKNNLGKEFTISADVTSTIDGSVRFYSLGSYGVGFNKSFSLKAGVKTRISATGVFIVHTPSDNGWCSLSFYGTYGTGNFLKVEKVMIEEGNTPHPWRPSLNDQRNNKQ